MLDACIQNFFSEFQLCIGWGKGELQQNFENAALFEVGKNREITEKYDYCSTIRGDFCPGLSESLFFEKVWFLQSLFLLVLGILETSR